MRSRIAAVFLLSATLIGALSCGSSPAAASVGGRSISAADFDREIDTLLGNPLYTSNLKRSFGSRVKSEDHFRRALTAKALTSRIWTIPTDEEIARRGIVLTAADRREGRIQAAYDTGDNKILAAFQEGFRKTLIERAARMVALQRVLVSGETPEKFYKAHKAEFLKPCARDIFVKTREESIAARRRVESGEDFADVARDVSLDKSFARKGGDLGCNAIGDLVPAVDQAVLRQIVGRIGDPVRVEEGYHILLVYSRTTPPLQDIKGEIAGAIKNEAAERADEISRNALGKTEVDVSSKYGTWDTNSLEVLP